MEKKEIKLTDLFHFEEKDIKVQFNIGYDGTDAYQCYKENKETINTDWLKGKTKREFKEGEIVLIFIRLPKMQDKWLLTCIKRIIKESYNNDNKERPHDFEGEVLEEYRAFFDRVIFSYHNQGLGYIYRYNTVKDKLSVYEIISADKELESLFE